VIFQYNILWFDQPIPKLRHRHQRSFSMRAARWQQGIAVADPQARLPDPTTVRPSVP
jgi:hypothetical protein